MQMFRSQTDLYRAAKTTKEILKHLLSEKLALKRRHGIRFFKRIFYTERKQHRPMQDVF